MKRSIKKDLYEVLQAEYINGNANLEVIGMRFGVTRAYVALVGRDMFPDWPEICRRKKSQAMKKHWEKLKQLDIMLSSYDGCLTTGERITFVLP